VADASDHPADELRRELGGPPAPVNGAQPVKDVATSLADRVAKLETRLDQLAQIVGVRV
jgi:hypothetical protein